MNKQNLWLLLATDWWLICVSSGPSELDLSLLGESSSLSDVACKYDEVRSWFIYSRSPEGDRACFVLLSLLSVPYFSEFVPKYCEQKCKSNISEHNAMTVARFTSKSTTIWNLDISVSIWQNNKWSCLIFTHQLFTAAFCQTVKPETLLV